MQLSALADVNSNKEGRKSSSFGFFKQKFRSNRSSLHGTISIGDRAWRQRSDVEQSWAWGSRLGYGVE